MFENPWAITTDIVAQLSVFGYEARDLKNKLIDFPEDTKLKSIFEEKCKEKANSDFWKVTEKDKIPSLAECAYKIVCFFSSTYVCESTFSKVRFIQNKHRSRLTNDNVDSIFRMVHKPANIDANTRTAKDSDRQHKKMKNIFTC